jgi:hypothetical protein
MQMYLIKAPIYVHEGFFIFIPVSPSSVNFVGIVVGFLNVLLIRLRSLLLATLKRDSSTYEL